MFISLFESIYVVLNKMFQLRYITMCDDKHIFLDKMYFFVT